MIRVHPRFQGGYEELSRLLHLPSVPDYIRRAIQPHPRIGFSFEAIPDQSVPPHVSLEWWNFVMFASAQNEWLVTTGELEIRTPLSTSVIHPDVDSNEVGVLDPAGGFITTIPSDAWGKACPSESWPLRGGVCAPFLEF